MISHAVTLKAVAYLDRRAHVPWFPLLVGLCAFLVTITLTLPVELLVVMSVLISPTRWGAIGLSAALGGSVGSLGLYLAFHHLGWNLLIEWYPDIAKSKLWADSTRWLSEYGALALFVLMTVPLPVLKTPALAFVAIYRMPIYEVALAIILGKLLKYLLYAYVVSRFPKRFALWYAALVPKSAMLASEPSASGESLSIGSGQRMEGSPLVDLANSAMMRLGGSKPIQTPREQDPAMAAEPDTC